MPGTDFDIANAAYILVRSIFCLNLFILITLNFQPSHLGKDASRSFLCRCFFCWGGAGRAEKTSKNSGSPTEAFSHSLAHLQAGSFNRSERQLRYSLDVLQICFSWKIIGRTRKNYNKRDPNIRKLYF